MIRTGAQEKPTLGGAPPARNGHRPWMAPARHARSRPYLAAALGVVFVVVVFVVLAALGVGAGVSPGSSALASVSRPLGGGKIESVSVVGGPRSRAIPVQLREQQLWPRRLVRASEQVSIQVVIKRPGWISWLAGSTERLRLTMVTPSSSLEDNYLTLSSGEPLRLRFNNPVAVVSYGPAGSLRRHVLGSPQDEITVPRAAPAGTLAVAGLPRRWESTTPSLVSWFPAGAAASAVASPSPGSRILPSTPITLTFNKPVDQALGSSRPPVSPITPGTWHDVNSHTIVFQPQGYGYGLGATVGIGLPSGVDLVGGHQSGSSVGATWTVPSGSTLRLQQVLSILGYLPLRFHYAGPGVALTPQAEEGAAVNPPAGQFSWRYSNVPSALHGFWSPGASGVVTRGAVMAFEEDHGFTPDGVASAGVWRSLIGALLTHHRSTFGYTFVSVNEDSQSLTLWHNGHNVLTTPVNTGIASDPTATGTYPVFDHEAVGTMSGTNPDGSHYSDPGIPWISYFNGGDALHGFVRASYGTPQSLGCVEMPISTAGQVWPYTPVGTLVNVT